MGTINHAGRPFPLKPLKQSFPFPLLFPLPSSPTSPVFPHGRLRSSWRSGNSGRQQFGNILTTVRFYALEAGVPAKCDACMETVFSNIYSRV